MFLSITARPNISLSPGPIYAESGGDVVLPKCHVTGYPPPVVSCTKLFDELPGKKGTVKDHTLTIKKSRQEGWRNIYLYRHKPYGHFARHDDFDR